MPAVPASEKLEGTSMVPILEDPVHYQPTDNFQAAYSQYPRCPSYDMKTDSSNYECLNIPKDKIEIMGYSVRVPEWRFTEWRTWNSSCVSDWTSKGLVTMELYDHKDDTGKSSAAFDDFENENMAYSPSQQALISHLSTMLYRQFSDNTGCT